MAWCASIKIMTKLKNRVKRDKEIDVNSCLVHLMLQHNSYVTVWHLLQTITEIQMRDSATSPERCGENN